jgi:PAS domain S-box-containing protein
MSFEYSAYILPLIIAAIISVVTATYTWMRRAANGALALCLMSLTMLVWTIGYSLEIAGTTLETKYLWGVIQYFGIAFASYTWLIFSFNFSNEDNPIAKRWVILTAVIPAITVLLALTTRYHGLIWSEYHIDQQGNFSALGVTHGTWWTIHFIYSYLCLLTGTIFIVRSMIRRQGMYRGQAIAMVIAVLAPWIGNALYLTGNSPIPYLDLTPFAFTVTTSALTWALFGFRLIDLSPIARDRVIESMQDGMIVLDTRGNIVDINNAAAKMIGLPVASLIGENSGNVFQPWPHLIERFRNVTEADEQISVGEGNAIRNYHLRFSALVNQEKKVVGRVIMLRDMDMASIPQPRLAENEVSTSVEAQRTGEGGVGSERVSLWKRITNFYYTPINTDLAIPTGINPTWHRTRERIFTMIARISASLGSLGFILSLPILHEFTGVTFAFGLFFVLLWILGTARNLKYENRVLTFLSVIYGFSFVETLNFGFSVESFTFFMSFIVTAAVLTTRHGAVRAFSIGVGTVAAFALLMGFGWFIPLVTGEVTQSLGTGLVSVMVFTAAAGAVQASVVMLLENLNTASQKETQALNLLQQERDLLEQRVDQRTLDLANARDAAIQENTERKRTQTLLQESESRFRQIIENASDLIYRTDARGNLTYINPTSMGIMGVTDEEEILGKNYVEIATPEWKHRLKRFYEKQFYRQVESTYFEFQASTFSGEEIWLGQNVQLIKENGEISGFQAVARNITELKKIQEALLVARDQALDASRLKSQLLSRVSHELRTPLGGILGYSELLQIRAFGDLTDKQKNAVDNIIQSTHYLTNIVNDLLDEAQIESRSISLNNEYFSPNDLIEKIRTSIAVLANRKGLALKTSVSAELPSELYGDMKRLQQVAINLAGNAVKFTKNGEVQINLKRPSPAQWSIEVVDTGTGIAPEDYRNIFEPFRQVNNSITRENRGSGLGLAITKQLIELMDGQIKLESQLGQGSIFTVLLPIKNAPGE